MGLSVKSPQKLGSPHLEFQIKSYAIYRAAAQGRFRAECVNFQFRGSSYILNRRGSVVELYLVLSCLSHPYFSYLLVRR